LSVNALLSPLRDNRGPPSGSEIFVDRKAVAAIIAPVPDSVFKPSAPTAKGIFMERVNEFDLSYRDGDSGVKYLFKGPCIDWGVLRFMPNQELGRHYHEKVEETFYFTKGNPKMIVNDEEIRIRPGDAIRLQPGDVHNIINDTLEPFEAVFMKTPHDPADKVKC